jgi:hypothetical protein
MGLKSNPLSLCAADPCRDATMTGAHRMHAPPPVTTTAFVTPKANFVPSLPMLAQLASAMVTVVAPAPESKGSPTTMQTTTYTMENQLEIPRMIMQGGLTTLH